MQPRTATRFLENDRPDYLCLVLNRGLLRSVGLQVFGLDPTTATVQDVIVNY